MTNNDFQRSNLTIQPKQRLMSAVSFISPAKTYDANEQIRIVESFRGLSAESDNLIDGFIKKKQDEAQRKADQYMTDAMLDPNHPDHKKAKEMLNGLKPQMANLLGVDYWTQQYISKAQAEQLFKKEEYEMADAKQKYANLSPDEFREKLGQIRVKIDDELTTYPKSVRDYFYRMPRQELTDKIRDKHYEAIMQEQLKTRDNIFKGKLVDTFSDVSTGLLGIQTSMVYEDEFVMKYKEFTPERQEEIENQAVKLGEIFGDVAVTAGSNGQIIKTEMFNHYAGMVSAIEASSLFQTAREYIIKAADAGMNSEEIQNNLLLSLQETISRGEDEEMAAAAFVVLMTKLNTDSKLSEKLGTWRYGNNKQFDANSKDVVNFDMTAVETKAKELISYGSKVRAEEIRRAEINDHFERKEQEKFLELAARSEKVTLQDWLMLDGVQIAEKLGVDYYKYKDTLNAYQQSVKAGFNVEYTDRHSRQYADTLYAIQTGKIKDKKRLYEMAGRNYHIDDFPKLITAFENEGGAKADERMRRVKTLMYRVEKDIEGAVNDGLISEREANDHIGQIEKVVLSEIERGRYDSISLSAAMDEVWELAQKMNVAAKGKKIYSNGKPDETTLQTKEQYSESVVKHLAGTNKDENTGISYPVYKITGDTFEDWLQNDAIGQAVNGNPTLTEEQKLITYNSLKNNNLYSQYQIREKEIRAVLNKGNYSYEEFTQIVKERPDLIESFFGMKYVIEDGVAVPANKMAKDNFYKALQKGDNIPYIIKILSFASKTSKNAYAK